MSNRTSSVAFILMLVATASLAWSQESPSKDVQYAAAEVNELELRFELIRTPAAPYQAVQYRATLNNKGSRTLGPIWPLESRIALKNETSEEYRELRNYGFLYDSGRLESPTNLLKKYTRVPILLKQGEAISQSFAVAAEWNYEKVGDSFKPRGTPLFPNPGTYRLCYVYRQGLDKVTKTYATVKVPEPSGADKGVYDLVRKDQDLAAALMRTVDVPPDDVIPKLHSLLESYPKSSYAPYARFALARNFFNGTGFMPTGSEEEKGLAVEELKKLKDESFPYLPNVLKMLMLADPRSAPDCERRMDRDFPDALEWLEYKAGNMTAKEWQEFRVRPAEERKEKR